MELAPLQKTFSFTGFEQVKAGIVKWPMSVLRLTSDSKEELINLADKILQEGASIQILQCRFWQKQTGYRIIPLHL